MMTDIDTVVYKDEKSDLWVRDAGEQGVIRQMNDYKSLIDCGIKNPVVLDLGGHIGSFVWFAKKYLDPKRIVSVEPDPRNIEIFKLNWASDPNVELVEGAVAAYGGHTVPLYLGKTYSSCNSLESFRGRKSIDVKTFSFDRMLDVVQPNIIKCDIEGGEFNLDWTELPESVKFVIMELHQQRPQWIEQAKELDFLLLDQGFEHVVMPKHTQTYHRVGIGARKR